MNNPLVFVVVVAVAVTSCLVSGAPTVDLMEKYPSFSLADVLDKKGFKVTLALLKFKVFKF
jgi:hypothetical protein